MLHGFGVDHRILSPLVPTIAAAGGWRTIALDLPWTASATDRSARSAADVVRGVQREITEVIGDEPFAILGNSFGGMLARHIAHDWRERVLGLATIAGVFVADHARRTLPSPSVVIADADVVASAGEGGYEECAVVQTAENLSAWSDVVAPALLSADKRVMAYISREYDLPTRPEASAVFEAPTLILTGRQDAGVGYADAWRQLEHYPRATFAVLDSAGHNTHLDAPELAAAHITDWLRRIRIEMDRTPRVH